MNAVDTNIWIYCHDGRDPVKQAQALQIVAGALPLALPWQVGCEFIAASRKLVPFGFSQRMAWAALADMRAMANSILLPEPLLWTDTESLQGRFSLSFWDAMIVAACIRGGVTRLYTEDFGGTPVIDTVSLVNPFATP